MGVKTCWHMVKLKISGNFFLILQSTDDFEHIRHPRSDVKYNFVNENSNDPVFSFESNLDRLEPKYNLQTEYKLSELQDENGDAFPDAQSVKDFLDANLGTSSGSGSGGSANKVIDIDKAQRFLGANISACRVARDAYFQANPDKKITDTYIVLDPQNTAPDVFLERYNGLAWIDVTEVIKGSKGDKGDPGEIKELEILDVETYGDFNDVTTWIDLHSQKGNVRFYMEGDTDKFKNTPLQRNDYEADSYKVFGEFIYDTKKSDLPTLTQTFKVYEYERSHVFVRTLKTDDPDQIKDAEWHILTGLETETLHRDGTTKTVPISKFKTGAGLIAQYLKDKLVLTSTGTYSNVKKTNTDFSVINNLDVFTVFYEDTVNIGKQNEITIPPVDSLDDEFNLTIICSPQSLSVPKIVISSQSFSATMTQGTILQLQKSENKRLWEFVQVGGTAPLRLTDKDLTDLKNEKWDGLVRSEYVLINEKITNLHPDIDGKDYDFQVKVEIGFPIASVYQTITVLADDSNGGRQFIRSAKSKPISEVDFKEIGGSGSSTSDGGLFGKSIVEFSSDTEIDDDGSTSNGVTYIYKGFINDAVSFWIKKNPGQLPDGWHIYIVNNFNSAANLSLFTNFDKQALGDLSPSEIITIRKIDDQKFGAFLINGTTYSNELDNDYLNAYNPNWANVPTNNYTIGNKQGTFSNTGITGLDGKKGMMIARVFNSTALHNPTPILTHTYTIVSDDASINGRIFKRTVQNKLALLNTPFTEIGGGGGNIVNPIVDSSNPLEVKVKDGTQHDAIAINDENDLVVGSRSSGLNSFTLATPNSAIRVYRKDADTGIEVVDYVALRSEITTGNFREKRTIYFRGTDYVITEDDIQKDIFIQAEPFIQDGNGHYSSTVMFPSIDVFKKYYYIPNVNENDKNRLPHIQNFTLETWLDPETGKSDKENRLYLKSTGNSVQWGTSTKIGDEEGCFIRRPANDTSRNDDVGFRFMKIEVGGSETGPMKGYTLQAADEDNVFSLTTTPPAPEPPASPISPHDPVEIDARVEDSYSVDLFDVTSEYVTEFITTTYNTERNTPFYILVPPIEDYEADSIIEFSKRYFNGNSLELRIQLDRNYPDGGTTDIDLMNFTKIAFQKNPNGGWTEIDLPDNHTNNKQVEENTHDIAVNEADIASLKDSISYREFKQVTTLSAIHLDDDDFSANDNDKEEIAKTFKQGTLEGDNNYILRMNQFATKDFHGFLPESTGGLFEVISVNSFTHRDPSNGETFSDLPPAKEHRLVFNFYADSGKIWSATLTHSNNFFDFKEINSNEGGASQEEVDQNKNDIIALYTEIDSLAALVKTFYKDFDLTYLNETLSLTMKANDELFNKTKSISVNHDNPPVPDNFEVYAGWIGAKDFSEIAENPRTSDGQAIYNSSKSTLLTDTFTINRDLDTPKYMYIAYPKGAVDPDPKHVNYNSFPAEWGEFEQVLKGSDYIVLCSPDQNIGTTFNLKLEE